MVEQVKRILDILLDNYTIVADNLYSIIEDVDDYEDLDDISLFQLVEFAGVFDDRGWDLDDIQALNRSNDIELIYESDLIIIYNGWEYIKVIDDSSDLYDFVKEVLRNWMSALSDGMENNNRAQHILDTIMDNDGICYEDIPEVGEVITEILTKPNDNMLENLDKLHKLFGGE